MEGIDRYEAEQIAERAAESACRDLKGDLEYEIRRAVEDAVRTFEQDLRQAIRDHVEARHSDE